MAPRHHPKFQEWLHLRGRKVDAYELNDLVQIYLAEAKIVCDRFSCALCVYDRKLHPSYVPSSVNQP